MAHDIEHRELKEGDRVTIAGEVVSAIDTIVLVRPVGAEAGSFVFSIPAKFVSRRPDEEQPTHLPLSP